MIDKFHVLAFGGLLVLGLPLALASDWEMLAVRVTGSGFADVNGVYRPSNSPANNIPVGFVRTCNENGWNSVEMWEKLYDKTTPWFMHVDNDSYIYRNRGDGRWWIDGPSGAGVFIEDLSVIRPQSKFPPTVGWVPLEQDYMPLPTVTTFRMDDDGGL